MTPEKIRCNLIKEEEIYQPSPLEILTNEFWKLQRLQDEGQNVDSLMKETWDKIKDIIELDGEEGLTKNDARAAKYALKLKKRKT